MKANDWAHFDGRKVERIIFPRFDTDTCPYVESDGEQGGQLTCHVEYLGDRSEVWIVQTRDGAEVARHNARGAETIVWG